MEAKRDWGFAGDYVEAMWLMLQQEKPDDYVIGTGENHTVKEFVEVAFGVLGLDWQKYVVVDENFSVLLKSTRFWLTGKGQKNLVGSQRQNLTIW